MPRGDRLFELLKELTDIEKEYLTRNILELDTNIYVNNLSKEIRAYAGNSVANIFRDDHDLEWKKIIIDVANKLNEGIFNTDFSEGDGKPEKEIEEFILNKVNDIVKEKWILKNVKTRERVFEDSTKYFELIMEYLKSNTKSKQFFHIVKEPLLGFTGTAYRKIIPTVIFILNCNYLKHIKLKMQENNLYDPV